MKKLTYEQLSMMVYVKEIGETREEAPEVFREIWWRSLF